MGRFRGVPHRRREPRMPVATPADGSGHSRSYSYWVAICKRGHLRAWRLHGIERLRTPGIDRRYHPPYCAVCGAPVTDKCDYCRNRITSSIVGDTWEVASFCWSCSHPYDWATREERVSRLQYLLESEALTQAQRVALQEQLAVLAKPVDQATDEERSRAAEAIKRIVPRLGETALAILRSLVAAELRQVFGLP
jgi:hypothetical protein